MWRERAYLILGGVRLALFTAAWAVVREPTLMRIFTVVGAGQMFPVFTTLTKPSLRRPTHSWAGEPKPPA